MKRKLLSIFLVLVMLLAMVPMSVFADGGESDPSQIAIAFSDCTEIGTFDDDTAYYYDASSVENATGVIFSDLEENMSEGMIACMNGNYNVEGTNAASLVGFGITKAEIEEDDGWDFSESFDLSAITGDLYAYWITDDNYDMYYVLVQADAAEVELEAPTFTAKAGEIEISQDDAELTENGYTYKGFEYAPNDPNADSYGYIYPDLTCDLYTILVPKGTETVDFTFSSECLAYGYDDDAETCTEGMSEYEGGYTGKTTATRSIDKDEDGNFDFVQVQSVYDNSYNSVRFYAISFKVYAEDADITLSLAKGGNIISDKNGSLIAGAAVTVSDKNTDGVLTIDEALYAAHEAYYDGGAEAGYASSVGQWGLSLDKLWGDTSYNFGYYVNDISAWGLSDEIKSGDYVAAYITESTYPDNEGYSWFTKKACDATVGTAVELELKEISGYDEEYNPITSACAGATITVDGAAQELETDENGKASLILTTPGTHIISAAKTKVVGEKTVTAIVAPVCVITTAEPSNAKVTVPTDAELSMALKNYSGYNYKPFDAVEAIAAVDNGDGTSTYYYEMINSKEYYYRVSGEDYITYAGFEKYTSSKGINLTITEAMLAPEGKTPGTVDRDLTSNSKFNLADIYLNINAQGYLKMNEAGDTYQLIYLRNWQAVNNTMNNVYVEPDYNFTVLDLDGNESSEVIEISDSGIITAVGNGTAIVLVTYDAMNYAQGLNGTFYGAIWPENTGVFVVSVGAGDSGITNAMTVNVGKNPEDTSAGKLSGDYLDAEHDIIYFVGESGEYTFTPAEKGTSVSVANPTVGDAMSFTGFKAVKTAADGSVTVPLTEGRNIVKLEKNGKAEYQIISAKKISYTINGGEAVHAGDEITIVFDTLYHPANKLAGIYNMTAYVTYRDSEGKLVGSKGGQYNFASTAAAQTVANYLTEGTQWGAKTLKLGAKLTAPEGVDSITLSEGTITVLGWGDPFGNHRGITLENGKAPNLNAAGKAAELCVLPDIVIPIVVEDAEIVSISAELADPEKEYYQGDAVSEDDFTVTASYDNDTKQKAAAFEISTAVLDTGENTITITYREKTAQVTINAAELEITELTVTSNPSKTEYTEGEVIDPSGMVVTATYNSGKTEIISDYSYSPARKLNVDDTKIIITAGDAEASVDITVKAAEEDPENPSGTIVVLFCLKGDDNHFSDDDGIVHTLSNGNLTTWISTERITLPEGSYVIDAVKTALGLHGIPFTNPSGNYIDTVKGLGEFDNGANSGWMYTLNGKYPNLGVSEQTLKDGDVIVFHYTDDYTLENYDGSPFTPSDNDSSNDKKAAEKVSAAIDAIGEVSLDKADEIKAAREAYDALTDAQKELVENEDVLIAAEEKLDELMNESTGFTDVDDDDWFADAVEFASSNGLMNGVSDTEFAPNAYMTRAMLMTVLARMAGIDTTTGENWYDAGMEWAMENNISDGSNPQGNITREQLVTMLWRYIGSPEVDADLSGYTDEGDVSDWAKAAMQWAISIGLINGRTETTIVPGGTATRAEVATILMRYCEKTAK